MVFNYSDEFKSLVKDKEKARELIKGSEVQGADFGAWEKARSFIVKAIDRDGTVLDIGCANGFLLRCLQEWSKHKLIPYGIDTNKEHINTARQLFPEHRDNFVFASIRDLPSNLVWKLLWRLRYKLPQKYEMVYWNVWDNRDFIKDEDIYFLNKSLSVVKKGGRLILGFYQTERAENLKRIKNLERLGYKVEILKNSTGPEVVVWFNFL